MAYRQMDAISSFQFVTENAPQWKATIANLSTYAARKHEEFMADYSQLLHQAKVKRSRSASMTSIHSDDDFQESDVGDNDIPLKSPRPSELVEINPLEAGNRFIYAQARRKRRPGTSMRSNASGPRTIRSKQMVVIYYDSHIQHGLDQLVKGFGAARNNLRKGKNAYTVAKGFSLAGLTRRHETRDSLTPNAISKSAPRLSKAQSDSVVETASNPASPEAAFANTDKEIEAVQALCETAAHQMIRDGDCKIELQDACSKLDTLLALAQSSLDMLKAEKQKQEQDEASSREGSSVSDNTSAQSTLCEKPSMEALSVHHKSLTPLIDSFDTRKRPPIATIISAPTAPIALDAIEVDDGSDDESSIDIELDLSHIRAGRRLAV